MYNMHFPSAVVPLTDCWSIKESDPTLPSGLYKVFLGDGEGEFTVFCDMDLLGGGWTVIQRRIDDTFDFQRTWNEYRNGFGDFNKNFWLGLKKVKRITDTGNCEFYIGLERFSPSTTAYARYGSFSLGSEPSNYKLIISDYDTTSTAGDSLTSHNNQPFSTTDRDNDPSVFHCAQLYKAGWWYKDCHDSNLNGIWYDDGNLANPSVPDGIMWEHWLGDFESVKTSVMAVRRTWV